MIKKLDAIRGLKPMAKDERCKFNITDLGVGGYFTLKDQSWLVLELNKYVDVKWRDFSRRKRDEWVYELTIMSLKTGEVKYIEYLVPTQPVSAAAPFLQNLREHWEKNFGNWEMSLVRPQDAQDAVVGLMPFWCAIQFESITSLPLPSQN